MTTPIPVVAAYDPYVGRAVDGVKNALADGYPVMVRLHPAGAFIGETESRTRQLDREGYAVLLTGYDDDLGCFLYVDPARNEVAQLPYDEFGVRVVDSTLDFALVIADLQSSCTLHEDRVSVRISQYQPHMPVIDQDTAGLEHVVLESATGYRAQAEKQPDGTFVGDLPLAEVCGRITVTADLVGLRPTTYTRRITAELTLPVLTA